MAAVFFKYTTDKPKASSKDHSSSSNKRRAAVEDFLRCKGWQCIGGQGFYSEPSFGSAKDQLLAQANALRDIEDMLRRKPSLRDCVKDSLIIVGQVYDIESLLENSRVKTDAGEKRDKHLMPLDLESFQECATKKDHGPQTENTRKQSIANRMKATKIGQPKGGSPATPRQRNNARPARVRPMGSAGKVTSRPIVNFPKTPVKTANNKSTASILTSGRCPSDINSNLLADGEYDENLEDDDMTPLYLPCLEEEEASDGNTACCTCANSSYHVETFVKMDNCAKSLGCTNINVDPSERVVV